MLTTKQYLKHYKKLQLLGVEIVLSPVISAMVLVPDRPDLAGSGKDPRLILSSCRCLFALPLAGGLEEINQ